MARDRKCRRVCFQPENSAFTPDRACGEAVVLTVEEWEAIRLVDHEDMEQADAALRMAVSRGTFQRILYGARHKIAEAVVVGKGIQISGGDYAVSEMRCDCRKKCASCKYDQNKGE